MVLYFVRQVKQSKHTVRNCTATHTLKVLEYITVVHITVIARVPPGQIAGMEDFVHFVQTEFSPTDKWSLTIIMVHLNKL